MERVCLMQLAGLSRFFRMMLHPGRARRSPLSKNEVRERERPHELKVGPCDRGPHPPNPPLPKGRGGNEEGDPGGYSRMRYAMVIDGGAIRFCWAIPPSPFRERGVRGV